MASHTHELTPEQAANTASRMEYDRLLIIGGAAVDARNVITPSANQVALLREDAERDLAKQRTQEYLAETPAGQQIQSVINGLNAVIQWVENNDQDFAQEFPMSGSPEWDVIEQKGQGEADTAKAFLKEHPEIQVSPTGRNSFAVNEPFRVSVWALQDIAASLASHPRYELGGEVSVMRNGKNGIKPYKEDGWQYEGVTAEAQLRVSAVRDGQGLMKDVKLIDLDNWNGHYPTTEVS